MMTHIGTEKNVCYNAPVVIPNPATERGCLHGNTNFNFSFCYGWCSLPLHLQMVRQEALMTTSQKKNPGAATPGFLLVSTWDTNFNLPIGIIAYAKCRRNIFEKRKVIFVIILS